MSQQDQIAFIQKVLKIENDSTLDEYQKRKAIIKLDLSARPQIDVLYELETVKIRLECLPGGDAYEMLVKQHPIYQQLQEKIKMQSAEIDSLNEKIDKLKTELQKCPIITTSGSILVPNGHIKPLK
jgi:hypothetical protein